ncbi:MAG: cupin domain-containing protein, partial [Desulfobacterales bacterium]|nr:cupin domain-containing protein [Desulfobacterales bacterium]
MDNVGVPGEAYNYLADNEVYVMLAPEGNKRAAARPAITGDAGLEVVIVQCQPGHGPALHAHTRTNEIFVCMSGRYELMWGDKGENSVFLEPFDMFAVPKGVFRRFRNASEDPSARMMVMVQGGVEDAFNDVYFDSSVGEAIEAKWGKVVHGNFKNIGITFEGADPR